MRELVASMLRAEEGVRRYAYDDRTGEPVMAPRGKLTIGVGRNIQEKPLSDAAIDFLLAEDITDCWETALSIFEDFLSWKEGRQLAVIGMIFQLGAHGFLGFRQTIKAMREKTGT